MAYGVIMLYHLHMPSYILRTFTEYPSLKNKRGCISPAASLIFLSSTQMFFIPDNHSTTSRYRQIRDAYGCVLPAENPLPAVRSGKP